MAGVLGKDFIEAVAHFEYLLCRYLDVGSLTLGAAMRLVDHYLRVRESEAFALRARGEEDGGARGGETDAVRRDVGLDVIHGIHHGEGRRHGAARRIDIERDLFFRILRLEVQHLRNYQVCNLVVDGTAEEDDAFFKKARVNVVRALAKRSLLDDHRHEHLSFYRIHISRVYRNHRADANGAVHEMRHNARMVNWRDVQEQAEKFVLDYKDAKDEDRDAKPFWKDLMLAYGVHARSIGAFEERVRVYGRPGVAKIDYFAPHKFLVEAKSRGESLDKAYKQALEYFDALDDEVKPRYIIVSDFASIRVYDLESSRDDKSTEFALEDLPQRVRELAFFTDEEVQQYKPEDPINVRAVKAIGKLYEAIRTTNHFTPAEASRLLTRLVFCFFAEDTNIFEKNALRKYIDQHTKPDGSDVGAHIDLIFQVLNTDDGTGKKDMRPSTLHPDLSSLPFVNGGLFKPAEGDKAFIGSRDIRDMLLACLSFDWSQVSPEIFGSMFQSVMDEKQRHDLGAHYTSEKNIRKVIDGLFLDDLKAELELAKTNTERLNVLWEKIAKITLLDPACGCGNFLVVAYKELRKIENEIIARLYKHGSSKVKAGHVVLPMGVDLKKLSKVSIENMYGIEIEPFPAEVAKLSLWLMDHMMNMELGALFGEPLRKLPLTEAPHIVQGNALRIDWESVVPKEKLTHILGNPPFLGKKEQDEEQKKDMETVWGNEKGTGVLDYVTCWYKKAADLIAGTRIRVAFVSTNSITQGEQVGVLWPYLLLRGIKIHFAHRTFRWSNEATGKAAVHCVIVGFGDFDVSRKYIFEYEDIKGEPELMKVENINPYLVGAPDVVVEGRTQRINDGPKMNYGSMPIDKGALILSAEDAESIKKECPQMAEYVRPYMGGEEFLNGGKRFCLWLDKAAPEAIRTCSPIRIRVESARDFRANSGREATKKLASTPYRFGEVRQPENDYILIPKVSSENRQYMPIGIISADVIASGSSLLIPEADFFTFGILSSVMHMAWMRAVCGRLESRYQYSAQIVYNNFPWPEKPTDAQKKVVEDAAQAVLDVRKKYPTATLADLYDPNTMPADLLKAHKALDKAVDACYGKKNFKSEPERLEFLFERYQEYIAKK